MPKIDRIILLSGPICSGKTTLLNQLNKVFKCNVFKTSDALRKRRRKKTFTRGELQQYGENLDKRTKGKWIVEYLDSFINDLQENDKSIVIVDSVRIKNQIDAIRKAFGQSVFHFHLTAPEKILEERYKKLKVDNEDYEFDTFQETQINRTERNINNLKEYADVLINTVRCTTNDLLIKAACHLGLYGREHERLVDVLVGGQYGSEGKGNIASYLAKDYDILIRVGGPNAGHKVYQSPNPYTFHQLPSGTLHSNAKLIIGPGAVINPRVILKEISDCQIDYERLSIDPQAMVISQKDIEGESDLENDISSTGSGAGLAMARKITNRGKPDVKLAKDVTDFTPFIRPAVEVLDKAFLEGKKIFLEGTQGTALSIHHGKYPWVTSRDTTVAGCLAETGISPNRVRKVIMVCRTYPIRVQDPDTDGKTSGWMAQEINLKKIADRSGIPLKSLEDTEITSTTKRKRRIGEFEWDLLRSSASLNAPSDIALTFVDYLNEKNQKARRFDQLGEGTIRFIEEVERVALAPVSLISTRFHNRSIIDRRNWR
jgi:adenylosuccinate synthase